MQDTVIDYAVSKGFRIVRTDEDGTCYLMKSVKHYSHRYLEVSPEGFANGREDYKAEIRSLLS